MTDTITYSNINPDTILAICVDGVDGTAGAGNFVRHMVEAIDDTTCEDGSCHQMCPTRDGRSPAYTYHPAVTVDEQRWITAGQIVDQTTGAEFDPSSGARWHDGQ